MIKTQERKQKFALDPTEAQTIGDTLFTLIVKYYPHGVSNIDHLLESKLIMSLHNDVQGRVSHDYRKALTQLENKTNGTELNILRDIVKQLTTDLSHIY